MSLGKIIGIGVVIGLIALGIGAYNFANGIQMTGVALEQGLSAEYQSAQIELDTYTKKIKESVGIANLKSDKLDQILKDAVSGRYADKDMKPGTGGALFSAIKEAYPQIDLNIYDRIIDQVNAGREAFKNKQNTLRDKVRAYETWLNSGLVQSKFISMMGYPSDNLEARIGKTATHGRDALAQMKVLVTSSSTNQSYETGTEEPLDFSTPKKN